MRLSVVVLALALSSFACSDPLLDLEACAATLTVDNAFELSTLEVARTFDTIIAQDSLNATITLIAESTAAFHRHATPQPEDYQYARTLASTERASVLSMLTSAVTACRAANATGTRLASRQIQPGDELDMDPSLGLLVRRDDGYPYFPFGYNVSPPPNGTRNLRVKAEVVDVSLTPRFIWPEFNQSLDTSTFEANLALVAGYGTPTVFFVNGREASSFSSGGAAMPEWAAKKYPGLTTDVGLTSFFGYDVDNPGAKVVWDGVLAAAVPVAMKYNVTQFSLANEPALFTANSTYTLAKFVTYLQSHYPTISDLNAAWGSKFTSYADPSLRSYMTARWHKHAKVSPQQVLDWGTFNAARGSEWFEWLQSRVVLHSGNATNLLIHIKADNTESPMGREINGLDRLRLAKTLTANGCDTRVMPVNVSHIPFPADPGVYSMDWVGLQSAYTWMKGAAPTKLTLDAEWHAWGTVHYRDPSFSPLYARTSLFLAHLSGLASIETWAWLRDGWTGLPLIPSELGGADFSMSLLTQPVALNAAVRASLEANALASHIAKLVAATKHVFVLSSESADLATFNDASTTAKLAAFSLATQLGGAGAGFMYDGRIAEQAPSDAGVQCLAGTGGACALVIPCTPLVSSATFDALKAAVGRVPMVVAGPPSCWAGTLAADDRNTPRSKDELEWVSHLPTINVTVAGQEQLAALDAAVGHVVDRPVSCVDGSPLGDKGGGPRLGLFCRSVGDVVVAANLLATDVSLGLETTDGAAVSSAILPFTGESVTLPMVLSPMQLVFMTTRNEE